MFAGADTQNRGGGRNAYLDYIRRRRNSWKGSQLQSWNELSEAPVPAPHAVRTALRSTAQHMLDPSRLLDMYVCVHVCVYRRLKRAPSSAGENERTHGSNTHPPAFRSGDDAQSLPARLPGLGAVRLPHRSVSSLCRWSIHTYIRPAEQMSAQLAPFATLIRLAVASALCWLVTSDTCD